MDLAMLWVVLIALGAFVLGVVGGWLAARRARLSSASAPTPLQRPTGVPGTDAAAAADGSTPVSGGDTPAAEAGMERRAAGPSGTAAVPDVSRAGPVDDLTAAARAERDERARYADIIGIETENASLRAVAARVPGLERRVRELEAAIDERTGASEAVLDLTGPDPVVRRSDAELSSD